MKNFILKMLSESGEVSFGRSMSFVMTAFCLGWDTAYLVFAMRHFDFAHMAMIDVLPTVGALGAQVMFISVFYGINKAHNAVTTINAPGQADPPKGA